MERKLSNKHRKVLVAIFSRPTQANIAWTEIESLLTALGAIVINKGGSVVTIKLNKQVATFHRPHPQKEAKKWAVNKIREFLTKARITP